MYLAGQHTDASLCSELCFEVDWEHTRGPQQDVKLRIG